MKLSHQFSGSLRRFAYWVANGTVGNPLLEGIDYSCIYEEASAMEQGFAIFANVIEMDDSGNVLNEKEAEYRAAQYIRQYVDREYTAELPFEDWEVHLY